MSALLFRLSCLQDSFIPVLPADMSKPDDKIFFPRIKALQLRVCSPAPEWAGVGNSRKVQGNQTINTLTMDSYLNLWGRITLDGLSRVCPCHVLPWSQWDHRCGGTVCPSKDTSTSPLLTPHQHHQPGGLMLQQGVFHTITRLSHYCAHYEPAVIPRESRAPMENRTSLVFSSKCQSGCTVMGCEHRGLTCGYGALMPSPWSRSRQKHAGVACRGPFCRVQGFLLLLLLERDEASPAGGCFYSYGLLHLTWFPGISSGLLILR